MNITRLSLRIKGDPNRVITQLFLPGGPSRIYALIERVRSIPRAEVTSMLATLVADYRPRHKDVSEIFRQNYASALSLVGEAPEASEECRLLLGAYFTKEYSLESAALFNPSMVLHPDQSGLARGSARFVMSLRACGEGHISCIEFRTGIVDARQQVTLEPPTRFALTARPKDDALYDKQSFFLKLIEMNAHSSHVESVLALLEDQFTISDLNGAIEQRRPQGSVAPSNELADSMLWLAHSNYELEFPSDSAFSERVIFPVSDNESRGIEDARFVRFTHPNGSITYYATYSAYDGFRVLPQFIETSDFRHFKMITLNGKYVQNKGMALFPRKVGDSFMMAGRLDGQNIYLLRTDNIHFWNDSRIIYEPKNPWEMVQVGNCGSPIETDAGWILLTHGVGPMRQYWIGALLLDRQDPSRVLGQLDEPMLVPQADERDGYVPNVVYSCGALRHGDHLIIPYAVSDSYTRVATVPIADVLERLGATAATIPPVL
jgi:predicted GH43/DUF377 family glycosyl hydrolase